MSEEHELRPTMTADTLSKHALADVLLWGLTGLTLDEETPALGALKGVEQDLRLILILAEQAGPGPDLEIADFLPVLDRIHRRVAVVIELFSRAERARVVPSAPEAPADPSEPPESTP